LPGKVLHEVVHNERIIGGLSPRCSQAAVDFYKIAVKGECHVTDARTAELCKLAENAYRDVNIAFANEMSLICDRLGVDVWELIALTNRHPRVEILRPGPGVGGHCIAVDPWFIFHSAPEEARLIHAARTINDGKPAWVVEQVALLADGLHNPTIACMGLAYKPDVDDLRESPSTEIAAALAARHLGRIVACEPFIDVLPERLLRSGVVQVDIDAALEADIIVFLTGHGKFREIAPDRLQSKKVFDACGLGRP
jgi:UDP-N-acetyl-D-mannosaminuronic acid dehydrogenase